MEVLRLVAEGLSNRQIADRACLSPNAVKSHVHEIFRKLHVGNRVEAALKANEANWL